MHEPDPQDDETPSYQPEPERKEPAKPIPIEEPGKPDRPEMALSG